MLVRILSYVASVLGSARHRAVLVSCLVLVFATSSVVGIMAMHDGTAKNAATIENADRKTSQENTIWLHEREVDNKNTVKETESTDNPDGQAAAEQDKINDQQTSDTATEPSPAQPEMTISTDEVSVPAGSTSDTVIVRVTDGNASGSAWTIKLNNEDDTNGITITDVKTDKGLLSFRIHVASSAVPGTYHIAIHAAEGEDTVPALTNTLTVNIPVANPQ